MNKLQQDTGTKSVFDRFVNSSGHDILALTPTNPQVPIHLVRKLWKEFMSHQPNTNTASTLAADPRFNSSRIKTVA